MLSATKIKIAQEKMVLNVPAIVDFLEGADYDDMLIVTKFYFTPNPFPNDTECYSCQQMLQEVKEKTRGKTIECLRKRLDRMARTGLIVKLGKNPKTYAPRSDIIIIDAIRDVIRGKWKVMTEVIDQAHSPTFRQS